MSSYIPFGEQNPNDTIGVVCLVDRETESGVLKIVTSSAELIDIFNEHTFRSKEILTHYVQMLEATSLPEKAENSTETLGGHLPLLVNSALTGYYETPSLRRTSHNVPGTYLASKLPMAALLGYVDPVGVHHMAYFTSYPAVRNFCSVTHAGELPEHELAQLLATSKYLPRVGEREARVFHGRLAEIQAEGVRIRQVVHRAPTVD